MWGLDVSCPAVLHFFFDLTFITYIHSVFSRTMWLAIAKNVKIAMMVQVTLLKVLGQEQKENYDSNSATSKELFS